MKPKFYILAAMALSIGTAQAVMAEETQVPDETQPGQTRGIMLGSPVQSPVLPSVKPVQTPMTAQKKSPATAVIKPKVKAPVISHTVKPAKHTPVKKDSSKPVVAEPVVATQPVPPAIVNVSNTSSVITAVLDRPGDNPKYKVGDKLVISVAANQDCNLVVFNYDSNHVLTQIFPNDYQTNGFVRSGETVQIGGPDSPFDYQIAGKGGGEKIFVYAYPTGSNAPLTIAMSPLAGTPFRSAELTPEQYRNMVNESKIFFSREVKIAPKKGTQLTSATSASSTTPNKIELSFSVEK